MGYDKLWNLAKPYYRKGRPMDIEHVQWMIKDGLKVCKKEKIDPDLLIPLIILHDVGYAKTSTKNPYNKNVRKAHMKHGAAIAKELLEKVNYNKAKAKKIIYYVSVHDNWALGKWSVYKDRLLKVFKELDFIWMASPKGFRLMKKMMKRSRKEMVQYIKDEQKKDFSKFSTKTTGKLFKDYLKKL